ncbi:MAG: urease accessory protein [Nitrospinae bacterium]|nr:urease accessory protein [Nitrospinota bacterium]
MTQALIFGFLLGLKHALEADHVAAVASLASKTKSFKEGLTFGITWGLGHTITLFLFGSAVLILDTMISEQLAVILEFFVGCMLVFMGGAVIREIVKKNVHLHTHSHPNGITHLHFHSHEGDQSGHQSSLHKHTHKFSFKALLVGMVHGMAGSSALILLTLDSVASIKARLFYLLLFGFGSICGMALLSIVIILPLRYTESSRTYQRLKVFIGLTTLFLGMLIMYETSNDLHHLSIK